MKYTNLLQQQREEAASPETTSARLTELAKINDNEIKKAIASNPNTSLSTLWELGLNYPLEVLNNPIFALLPLENPGFIDDIPEYTLSQFLQQKECPHWLIELAFKQQKSYYITINIIGYHREFWQKLKEKYPEIKINLQYPVEVPGANLENANLQGVSLSGRQCGPAGTWMSDLSYANLQGANLQDANLQDADLQGANLQGANLQDADLQGANLQGAKLQGAKLQGAKLYGTNIVNTLIESLIDEAASPETTSARLTELAKIHYPEIKRAIASNPNTPPSTLWQVGEFYPLEVLNNPILALLPLENPCFIDNIPENVLSQFLKENECPHWLIELAFKQQISSRITINILYYHREFWQKLKEKYPEIRINLQSANLQSANLQGVNLRSANLQGVNLRSANLEDANLKNANLQGANLQGANLSGWRAGGLVVGVMTNLENANLENANLENANLENANLENANLENANLENANVVNTLIEALIDEAASPETTSARLTELAKIHYPEITKAIVYHPNITPSILCQVGKYYPREVLNNPIFALLPLENPRFIYDIPEYSLRKFLQQKECPHWLIEEAFKHLLTRNITEYIIRFQRKTWNELRIKYLDIKINLQNVNLSRANLHCALLTEAILKDANLSGANLRFAILKRADLQHAKLQDADLENAKLQGANLQSSNLQAANLQNANLYNANLYNANLQNANLQNANLQNANLQNANLQDAMLYGANLQGANLKGTCLE